MFDTKSQRSQITVTAASPLRDKQVLQLQLVSDASGLRVASSKVVDVASASPTVGLSADHKALDIAVVREGDALRIYGANTIAGQTDLTRCFIIEAA